MRHHTRRLQGFGGARSTQARGLLLRLPRLKSTNGSFLIIEGREERLRIQPALMDGDEIRLGQTVLKFIRVSRRRTAMKSTMSSCGTDTDASFARCPNCGFDLMAVPGQSAQGQDGATIVAPPAAGEWGKTVVEPPRPRPDAGRRARFDRDREFYEPIDETRNETAVSGSTVAGDHTVIERAAPGSAR